MKPEYAIEVENLHKDFVLNHTGVASLKTALLSRYRKGQVEKIEVLKGLDFKLKWGESVAIIGRNGAGKSTLLSLLAKVYLPTSGTAKVNGRVAPLLELGAGFHPDLSGLENILFNAMMLGLTKKQVMERMDKIIAYAELEGKIDTPLRTYSSGMQARLGFAIAINVDADILIVDEAMSAGDFKFHQKAYDSIRAFRDAGGTLLFVSHSAEAVRAFGDRAIWLADGKVRLEGTAEEILAAYYEQA